MAVGEASKIHAVSYEYREAARKSNLAIARARPSGVATNARRGDVARGGGRRGREGHARPFSGELAQAQPRPQSPRSRGWKRDR